MNVYEKLQCCRVELQQMKLKKGGKNKYAGFEYYELADFIPAVNSLFDKHKLHSVFNIEDSRSGETGIIKEIASLKIINVEKPDEYEEFHSPTAEANLKGCTPIQSLGGVHTYMKRYLYLNALEICEPDLLDTMVGADQKKQEQSTKTAPQKETEKQTQAKMCSAEQLVILNRQDDPVKAYALKKFNVKALKDLTEENAQFIINSMKEKGTLK